MTKSDYHAGLCLSERSEESLLPETLMAIGMLRCAQHDKKVITMLAIVFPNAVRNPYSLKHCWPCVIPNAVRNPYTLKFWW